MTVLLLSVIRSHRSCFGPASVAQLQCGKSENCGRSSDSRREMLCLASFGDVESAHNTGTNNVPSLGWSGVCFFRLSRGRLVEGCHSSAILAGGAQAQSALHAHRKSQPEVYLE